MFRFLSSFLWGILLYASAANATAGSPVLPQIPGITDTQIKTAAASGTWLRLIHYEKKITGGYRSLIQDKTFFLNINGKNDPEAELRSTIGVFLGDDEETRRAKIRFPARLKFINRFFSLSIKEEYSPELINYMDNMRCISAAIVYSSYYMENPASIFGHTFIRLEQNRPDLIENGISFFAVTGNDRSPVYEIKGLTGAYPGRYSIDPFFVKAREYNDFENRDLWIYYLDLDEDARDTLIRHLWELLPAHYNYSFLSQNCSYHILSLVEPSLPGKSLTGRTRPIVIPVDTIKLLDREKLILKFEYRPSLRNIFLQRYHSLDENEKEMFHRFTDNPDVNIVDYSPALLKTLISFYDYRYPSGKLDTLNKAEDSIIFRIKIKLKRQLSDVTDLPGTDPVMIEGSSIPASRPHMMHGARRMSVYYGYNSSLASQYIMPEFRLTYHDLLDSSAGYPVNSAIEMIKLSGAAYRDDRDRNRFIANEITLGRITSLNDFSFYNRAPSWSLYAGALRHYDRRCGSPEGALVPEISASLGLTKLFFSRGRVDAMPSLMIGLMVDFNAGYSPDFDRKKFSIGSGPSAVLKLAITGDLIVGGTAGYTYYRGRVHELRYTSTARYLAMRDIACDISIAGSTSYTDYRFGMMKYW